MEANIIFPWQVERILSIKFPGETSRAEQAGYVSYIHLSTITDVHLYTLLCTPQGYLVTLAEVVKVDLTKFK